MLAQALVVLSVLALLTASVAAGTSAAAHVAIRRLALRSADGELERARQATVDVVAVQVRQRGADAAFSAPTPLPAQPACAAQAPAVPCPLTAAATVTITGESAALSGGAVTAAALQRNPGVGERRIAARITATVRGGDGTVLATRTQAVTLRTLAAAPYAVLTGALDAAGGADAALEGDSAGSVSGDDTRIHAVLVCRDGGSGAACAGATPRPVDVYADQAWDPGNGAPAGWMP
ncbi:MAG TPA: hypothetical protein VNJ51_07765 [Candidatus Dormibacteraeota bacterium]|nr:hypothetical protein [Candidatus Dormibacteraeota bacterium]